MIQTNTFHEGGPATLSRPEPPKQVRIVPFEKALHLLTKFIKDQNLSTPDANTLVLWLKSIPRVESPAGPCIKLSALQDLFGNFSEYLRSGDPTALIAQRGFKAKPVDVIEFIESKEYVGNLIAVWPGVKDNLWQIWHGPSAGQFYPDGMRKFEIVLTGSIRSGKSMTVQLSYEYSAYLLSLLWNPHAEYGLSAGRAIVLICQSVNQSKAERVLLNPIKDDVDSSPYFLHNFKRNTDINSKIIFPGKIEIMALTSEDTSALGENVFESAFTEANAMPVHKHSVKLRYSNKTEYNLASELYTKAYERQVATFNVNAPNYFGKIFVDSSAESPEDFAHQKMEEAKTDPTILVIQKAIWEVQPVEKFPPDEPRFIVEVGDAQRPSRIIECIEDAHCPPDSENILTVPMQLRKSFDADIESALKNFAGRVTSVAGAFLNKDWVTNAQVAFVETLGEKTLFRHEEVSLAELFGKRKPGEPVDWSQLIDFSYITDCIIDPQVPFSFRVDLSATGDATGIALSRINGYQLIENATVYNPRTDRYEQVHDQHCPIFVTDGTLRVISLHGEEIDVELIGELCLELNRHVNIKWAMTDRAESSRHLLQMWRKAEIVSAFLSVDTDIRPWMEAKNALREQRWLLTPHSVLDKEFKEVRKTVKGGQTKIDHPDSSTASKDCADAAVGSIFVLYVKESLYRDQNAQDALSERQGRSHRNETRGGSGDTPATDTNRHGNGTVESSGRLQHRLQFAAK